MNENIKNQFKVYTFAVSWKFVCVCYYVLGVSLEDAARLQESFSSLITVINVCNNFDF